MIALEGLEANSNKAVEEERDITRATSCFNAGRMDMQTGTIKVVAVELVMTVASSIAEKPNKYISSSLFNFIVLSISA
jgi:hypothetical protein